MIITRECRDIKEKCIIKKLERHEMSVLNSPERSKNLKQIALTEKQKHEIDDFYKENYGSKIPYAWHQYYTSFTGNFNVNYFPEMLYIPRLERYMNSPGYAMMFGNKNQLPVYAKAAGVKAAETVLTVSDGVYCDSDCNLISEKDAVEILSEIGQIYLKKSINTSGGSGCFKVDFCNGIDSRTGKSVEEFISRLGSDFIAQKVINQHPLLAQFEKNSAATFRVITYFWKGEIYSCPLTLRIGRAGSDVANAAIIIAIDEDGLIHTEGFSKRGERYFEHPDSHVSFANCSIPDTPKVIAAAKRLHTMVPQIGIIHWDFTIDETGEPVVIEANTKIGSIWLPEIVHGKAPFGDNTADILRWMRFMKRISVDDRFKYRPGFMER